MNHYIISGMTNDHNGAVILPTGRRWTFRSAIATGSGDAWIFTEGRLIRGTWNKPRARNVTEYFDENGKEIQLLPGRVWIELPPPGGASLR